MRRLAVAALVAALLLSVTSLSGCRPPLRVLVIGDSLTVGAVGAGLGESDRHTWIIDARVGRGTREGTDIAKALDLSRYDLVIVALGTNDYLDSKATYRARIGQMMAVLGSARPVVWVDVDTATAHLAPAALGVNPAIAEAAATHPNLTHGRWDAYVRSVSMAGRRAADQIHYTKSGYDLRARWMESLANR